LIAVNLHETIERPGGKRGINIELILALEQSAAAHRETGGPNHLADVIKAISEHFVESDVR
jgi:hypothetical protein